MAEEIPAVGQDATGVTIECAVCLQTCVHPVKLPCSHIFCFLCVKGVAFQSRRCAMCRQEIPSDVLLHPQLVDRTQLEKESVLEDGYQWFYEGRNGEFELLLKYIFLLQTIFHLYSLQFWKAGGSMMKEQQLIQRKCIIRARRLQQNYSLREPVTLQISSASYSIQNTGREEFEKLDVEGARMTLQPLPYQSLESLEFASLNKYSCNIIVSVFNCIPSISFDREFST